MVIEAAAAAAAVVVVVVTIIYGRVGQHHCQVVQIEVDLTHVSLIENSSCPDTLDRKSGLWSRGGHA